MNTNPTNHHKAQFKVGWNDGYQAAKNGAPLPSSYEHRNTWRSTGYREGYTFGGTQPDSSISFDNALDNSFEIKRQELGNLEDDKSWDIKVDAILEKFDPASMAEKEDLAEKERQDILARFPLAKWPTLPLEQYALGFTDSYCRWLEYNTKFLGSMKGDFANKKLIFKRLDGTWSFDDKTYSDVESAWTVVRAGFVEMFEKAKADRFEEIDEIDSLRKGRMIQTKSLYIYFPDKIIPIYSHGHLLTFLSLLRYAELDKIKYASSLTLNRILLKIIRTDKRFDSWSTWRIMEFLYTYFNPNKAENIIRVEPGKNGAYWKECVAGGYICVGWDEIGDLNNFNEDKDSFQQKFTELYSASYNNNAQITNRAANELWTFSQLNAGDIVVASQGFSTILGVGKVIGDGYEWLSERAENKHIVQVEWDTSISGEIQSQRAWNMFTVSTINTELYRKILSLKPVGPGPDPLPPPEDIDPLYQEIADALERKGQVILYGPPGTGKTYTALYFASWWLSRRNKIENSLQGKAANEVQEANTTEHLTFMTFHPSYSYEDFIEGFKPSQNPSTNGGLSLKLEEGIFKRVCREAAANPGQSYLVIIDEINRANLAKVFGELITLLEKDKRGKIQVVLPQSKEPFTIPSNVYVLGTMNTADKSIKLMDAALRRRFAFKELMPNIKLLEGFRINDLLLDGFLETLNRRIATKEGREKQIGHSFLLEDGQPVKDVEEFARRFRQEILPLLQEYCYDDYIDLAYYIGDKLVDKEAQTLNFEILNNSEKLVEALAESFKETDQQ